MKALNLKWLTKASFIVAIVFVLVTRSNVWSVLMNGITPILYALVVAYMLDYVVKALENRFKLKRGVSIAITLILFAMTIALIGLIIVPKIVDATASLITTVSNIRIDMTVLDKLSFDNPYLTEIQQMLMDALNPFIQKVTNFTGTALLVIVGELQRVTTGVISFMVSLIIAIYMLAEKRDLLARIKRTVFAYFKDETAERIYYIGNLADDIFKNFFVGKLLDSFIIGVLSFVILKVAGFEYNMLIAVIIGITNMIPYFGPFIGAVPSAIITFVATPTEPWNVFWILIIILIIQQLDGWVIGPMILSDSVGVSAFWIVIAVTAGGAAFGLLGMFLGVPVCVLAKTLIEDDVEQKLDEKGYSSFERQNLKVIRPKVRRQLKLKK